LVKLGQAISLTWKNESGSRESSEAEREREKENIKKLTLNFRSRHLAAFKA
jgi:hypothetical protein